MAININIGQSPAKLLSNELIYNRLDNQTPLDFAVSYLENIESLFSFYDKFKLTNYTDFYNSYKYRILKTINPMVLNDFEAATKADDALYVKDRNRIWKSQTDYRDAGASNIRVYI